MESRFSMWAPAGAMMCIILSICWQLWWETVHPVEPFPDQVPAYSPSPPAGPIPSLRDPFGRVPSRVVPQASASARPEPSVEPPSQLPEFNGTLVQKGRTYLVTSEGLIHPGETVGRFRIVSIAEDRVILEAGGRRYSVDSTSPAGTRPVPLEPRHR
jgi:hypothetical protein